jgi:hypothetical protein
MCEPMYTWWAGRSSQGVWASGYIGVCFFLGIVLSLFFNHENVGYQLRTKLFKLFLPKTT